MVSRLSALLVVSLVLACAAGPASAQVSPTQDAYGARGDQVQGLQQPSGGGPPGAAGQGAVPAGEEDTGGRLPFSGSDVMTAGLVGLVLLGAGFLVRRGALADSR